MKDAFMASFWMTKESKFRISNGGNSKGAVPVHGKQSATSVIPLYEQAAIDAAVAAEREACAMVCDARSKRLNDGNWTDDEWESICNANELAADEIRARSNDD